MSFLLHSDQLSERGTETSMFFLGKALQNLGHNVTVAYEETNSRNSNRVERLFTENFQLYPYKDFNNARRYFRNKVDFAYLIKTNGKDGKLFESLFNAIHVVFAEYLPHGNSYTYVSQTLAEDVRQLPGSAIRIMSRGIVAQARGCSNALRFDSVPHIVEMPSANFCLREELCIPADAFVILRYGGKETFDIPWAKRALLQFMQKYNNVFFVAMNTEFFGAHPRIIYLEAETDIQRKANLLGCSDLFLHARAKGESFGMAIVEAMQLGLPILSWAGGRDRNHVSLLKNARFLYVNEDDLSRKLENMYFTGRDKSMSDELEAESHCYRGKQQLPNYLEKMFRLDPSKIVQ